MAEEVDYEEDIQTVVTPTSDQLSNIAALAAEMDDIEQRLERYAEIAKELKEQHRKLSTEVIPSAMSEVGMQKFTLESGVTVEVDPAVYASISKKNESGAYQWLRDTGNGDIIKNTITVRFGAGEDETADKLEAVLRDEFGIPYDQKAAVHAGTLKAFVRGELENGSDIPHDLFGIFESKVTKLKKPS